MTLDVLREDPASIAEVPVAALPLDIMPFLLPSCFVSSDRLAAFAQREFGDLPQGHQRVTAICNWLYDNLDYQRGSTGPETTADEVLIQRAGLCRDFSHLDIAFCRALSIPARFYAGRWHEIGRQGARLRHLVRRARALGYDVRQLEFPEQPRR